MKIFKNTFLLIAAFFVNLIVVYAAPTHSIGVSRNTIESGQNVTATVTIKNVAAWNIHINGTGNTNGCSTSSADATSTGKNTTKSFSVTCKSNSTGIIKITYSGDATSEDGSTTTLSGSKTVTVVAPTPKSNNNYLKSLSIENAVISPEFNQDTLEYTSTVEAGTEKIVINASAADQKSSLTGVGEVLVVEGENKFEIKVTSESGQTRTYVLTVTVKEYDPIIAKVDGKEYTVVRKLEELKKPESFIETTVTIGEDIIPGFYNEVTKKTLVGLKDENGLVTLYEYKDGEYLKYYEFTFNQLTLNLIKMDESKLPKGYKKYQINLNNEIVDAYKLKKKSGFALVYGIDVTTGEKNLYQVDIKNNTVQLFSKDYEVILDKYNKLGYIVAGALGFIIFVELLVILSSKHKNKKITKKIKKEKIEKVKEAAIKDAKNDTVDAKKEKTIKSAKTEVIEEAKEKAEVKKEEKKSSK